MYLAQSVEEVVHPADHYNLRMIGFRLMVWRVEMNAAGRPVWAVHRQGSTFWNYSNTTSYSRRARNSARKSGTKGVPTLAGAAHGKLVTMSEAAKLVDVSPPASLDRLTEIISEGETYTLQNYVKPPKVKPPKAEPEPVYEPTPYDIARGKRQKALLKVAEWERRAAHAAAKAKEWAKRAKYHERRANTLA